METDVPLIAKTLEESKNPLLNWGKFPNFSEIKPAHVVPAFDMLLPRTEKEFTEREAKLVPTWEGTIELLQDLEDDLGRVDGLVKHLNNVNNSKDLREALEKIQPKITELSLKMDQSSPKYQALTALANDPKAFSALSAPQQRIVKKKIQSMQLAGVGLDPNSPEKKRFNEIQTEIAQLSIKFANNLLDAAKAFAEIVEDREMLAGCPERLLKSMATSASDKGFGSGDPDKGPWAVTLNEPVYFPFMMSCSNRSLREKVYRAYITRASSGELDNEPIINKLLKLRNEVAAILGLPNFAAFSLSQKMANNLEAATKLVQNLFDASSPAAKREFEELTLFAKDHLELSIPLQPWDVRYVSEEYRKHLFKYSDDEISKYFTFDRVIRGLFEFTEENFGVRVEEVDQEKEGITTWNKDVKVYKIADQVSLSTLAYFYGDFYSRPEEKNSGAWVDVLATRYKDPKTGRIRIPVGYVNCNAPPPSTSAPSIMTFQDVVTIFHEFGHCLQHTLTTVDYPQASGIYGIEWDFIEVASQFMENFCYEPEWITRLASHHETGEPMPADMINSLVKARQFLEGLAMTRQLHFAQVDLTLHSAFTPPEPLAVNAQQKTVFDVDKEIAQRMLVTPRIPEDRFLCGFLHIFSGEYASGYYSYKWSEVYSADAYAAFEEALSKGPPENKSAILADIGRLYRRTVLSLGGGTSPQQVWKLFRGREQADITPLLRHSGLLIA